MLSIRGCSHLKAHLGMSSSCKGRRGAGPLRVPSTTYPAMEYRYGGVARMPGWRRWRHALAQPLALSTPAATVHTRAHPNTPTHPHRHNLPATVGTVTARERRTNALSLLATHLCGHGWEPHTSGLRFPAPCHVPSRTHTPTPTPTPTHTHTQTHTPSPSTWPNQS